MAQSRKRPLAGLFLALSVALALSGSVFASEGAEQEPVLKAEDIDLNSELTLTVSFAVSGNAVSGAQIGIYKVADVYTGNYGVFYTATVGDYSYEGITAEESGNIAAELAQAVSGSGCEYYSGTTDEAGNVVFTGLSQGIYLVMLESAAYADDGGQYIFDPFLACVPLAMEEDGIYVWTYDVVSMPKSTEYTDPEPEEEMTVPEDETEEGTEPPEEETQEETEDPEENDPEPSVGDRSGLALWLILAAAASAGLMARLMAGRRGFNENN